MERLENGGRDGPEIAVQRLIPKDEASDNVLPKLTTVSHMTSAQAQAQAQAQALAYSR